MRLMSSMLIGAGVMLGTYAAVKFGYEMGKSVEKLNRDCEEAEKRAREAAEPVEAPVEAEEAPANDILEPDEIATEIPKPRKGFVRRAAEKMVNFKKLNVVRDIFRDPEAHKVEAYIEGEETVFRVKKKKRE